MKKNVARFFLFVLLIITSFGTPSRVSAFTELEREILIAKLQAQITGLLAQLQQLKATSTSTSFCHDFNQNLGVSSYVNDVVLLKAALNKEGISIDSKPLFDEDTATAVIAFQAKHGIRQTGYVGPLTRGKLNQLYRCAVATQQSSSKPALSTSATPVISYVQGSSGDRNILRLGESATIFGTNLQNAVNIRFSSNGSTVALIPVTNTNFSILTFTVPSSLPGATILTVELPSSAGTWTAITIANNNQNVPAITFVGGKDRLDGHMSIGSVTQINGNFNGTITLGYLRGAAGTVDQTYFFTPLTRCDGTNGIHCLSPIVPANVPAGQYMLYLANAHGTSAGFPVVVDAAGTLLSSKPDISVSSVTFFPASPKVNDLVTVSVTVTNNSSVDITTPFSINVQGTAKSVSFLQAHTSQIVTVNNAFSFADPGVKTLNFPVDISNSIDESNENNNVYVAILSFVTNAPSVSITSPREKTYWKKNTLATWTWKISESQMPVDIWLIRPNGAGNLVFAKSYPSNDGVFSWNVGLTPFEWNMADNIPNGEYRVAVCPAGAAIGSTCGIFSTTIYGSQVKEITVTSPAAGTQLRPGDTVRVVFARPVVGEKYSVTLYAGGVYPLGTLIGTDSSEQAAFFTIPSNTGLSAGLAVIEVSQLTSDGVNCVNFCTRADSGNLTITR
ncbi:MAG: peptidoglycan-binding protein [Patescibacteria group bacterium]